MSLRGKIIQEIKAQGPIPFSRYMELCLYDPELGYYSRSVERFGKGGDFYTSSDVHAVFGRLLARQFDEMWRMLGSPPEIEILELGPGRGLFAQDVLSWAQKKFPGFFRAAHYSLLEKSRALARKAALVLEPFIQAGRAATLAPPGDRLLARALPDEIPLIVFANEFFDALPVEILSAQGKLLLGESDGRLVETWVPASDRELGFLESYGVHPEEGERLEVPLQGQSYSSEAAGLLRHGFLVIVDYGYTRDEQIAGRHRGTLKSFRQHSIVANPYESPGDQDITADVNFTALAASLQAGGTFAHPLRTQSQFLMGIGEENHFADAFEDCRLPQERAKVALQLKHLVTPAGMGESFHVLLGGKGVPQELASTLSGLSFGRGNQ
ncbi:MAG TPA: SAM-dependent methyltransferase [Terriglobales bacterium]